MVYILIAITAFASILFTLLFRSSSKLKKQELTNTKLEEELSKSKQTEAILKERYSALDSDLNRQLLEINTKYAGLELKLAPLTSVEKERNTQEAALNELKNQCRALQDNYKSALELYTSLESEIDLFKETLDITSYGLYEPKYSFDLPEQYLVELEGVYQKQKEMISKHSAVICDTEWTVGGSKTEGRKMVNQATKLMLFAFNGECDALIAKVRWNNVSKARERIQKSFSEINHLGSVNRLEIVRAYLDLRLEELSLTYEYERKKHEQKEEQRLIREQMREEEKAQRELERAQKEAEEEATLYEKILEKARKELGVASKDEAEVLNKKISDLEAKLKVALEKRERAISQAQLTKVGNIYIISNIGSFGEDIYKIGMTRRFDPMDRIRELSDAALPFQFDVHAIIYSENAPQFEKELHRKFWERRINLVNNRKEFFKITLDEIEVFVSEQATAQIHFTKIAEAREYRQTLSIIEKMSVKTVSEEEKQKFPETLFDLD